LVKTIFLTLIIILNIGVVSYAENWELIGSPNSKFQTLIDKFSKSLQVSDKRDVIEAIHNSSHKVYIDIDSIKVASDGKRNFNLKLVFDEEQAIEGTDKKLKYIIARMFCDCTQEIMWFRNGEGYDKNGEVLRDSPTVYVPVDLKELPKATLERETWEFVCNYKKDRK
jgi:hypothetical protein